VVHADVSSTKGLICSFPDFLHSCGRIQKNFYPFLNGHKLTHFSKKKKRNLVELIPADGGD
jgi:hypothetical protein